MITSEQALIDELYRERAVHVKEFVRPSEFARRLEQKRRRLRRAGYCINGHPLNDLYRRKNRAPECRRCSIDRARLFSKGRRSHA